MDIRLRTLAGVAATALALAVVPGAAWADGPGQNPTPADCAAPPPGQPCLVVSGTSDHASTPVRSGDIVGYTFTLTNYGDADAGVWDVALNVDYDQQLDDSSAEVNGNPASVSYFGAVPDLADPFTVPAHGSATVTFSTTVLSPLFGVPRSQSSWIEVNGMQTSNDVVVSPPAVDLSIANGISAPDNEVTGNPVTGANIDLELDNHGSSTPDSTITVPVPDGWTVTPPTDDPAVSCSATASAEVCSVAGFDQGISRNIQFVLTPGTDTPVGTPTPETITLAPVGAADEFPSDNSVTFQLRNAGQANLSVAVQQDKTKVPAGGYLHYLVSVTNTGPNPATALSMALRVRTSTENGFSQLPPVGPGQIDEGDAGPQPAGPTYHWQPGTVAPGQTVLLLVTWRAEVAGATGHLETRTTEDPYNAAAQGAPFQTVTGATVTVVGH